jgi:hypothetical protein
MSVVAGHEERLSAEERYVLAMMNACLPCRAMWYEVRFALSVKQKR